jgi:hypothetical protein
MLMSMTNPVDTRAGGRAPVEDLLAWAKATEREIEEIRLQLAPLEERMAAARERLDLIRRLIGLASGIKKSAAAASGKTLGNRLGSQLAAGSSVEAHIEAILAERGEPMHIGLLRDALIQRGVPLPGRGDEANIIVRLRRDETKFTRTGRGTYGLATWGLPAVAPTRSKRVRSRRCLRS